MDAEIVDGKLVITLALEAPRLSSSGKTLLVATTRGNHVTKAVVEGRNVVIVANAFIEK